MIQELDCVTTLIDIPSSGIEKGQIGTVVHVFPGGKAYVVEFMTSAGETIDLVDLEPNQVSPISLDEVRRRKTLRLRKEIRAAIDEISSKSGPRMTLKQLQEKAPGAVPPGADSQSLDVIKDIRVVERTTRRKRPRVVIVGELIYDLKAAEPKQRRAIHKTWDKMKRSVRFEPLGPNLSYYQKRLNEQLEALK